MKNIPSFYWLLGLSLLLALSLSSNRYVIATNVFVVLQCIRHRG